MAWQVRLLCSWVFTVVQVVPHIIEEEIMEHMGERKTFSTILQMKIGKRGP
jgi:hypothetical protein